MRGEALRPPLLAGFGNVFRDFSLPPLRNSAGDSAFRLTRNTQVLRRAAALGLSELTGAQLLQNGHALYREITTALAHEPPVAPVEFTGARISELNRLLATAKAPVEVVVQTPRLLLDEPLRITGRGQHVDLRHASIESEGEAPIYAVRIEGASSVGLRHLALAGLRNGVLVHDSTMVSIDDGLFTGVNGYALVLGGASQFFRVSGCVFRGQANAAILISSPAKRGIVERNQVADGRTTSNLHAGIVLTDRSFDMDILATDNHFPKHKPMTERMAPCCDIIVLSNVITHNMSSGIYSDGATSCLFVANRIEGNCKEGMCLDFGSTANVVLANWLSGNGRRYGLSDDELRRDFVLEDGRMQDGTSTAKLPGLSIDNAAYNLVVGNTLIGNYGSGIKAVRTTFCNIIGLNSIISNNKGENDRYHFFGIELGAAPLDEPSDEIDRYPSIGNVVFSNMISGAHYGGIYLGSGSEHNEIFDNVIMNATHWSIEVPTLNNLSVVRSRHVPLTRGGRIKVVGAIVIDKPRTPAKPVGGVGRMLRRLASFVPWRRQPR